MENNYNDEYMKRKEKIFVVNYFDKKEMRWFEEEMDLNGDGTREKYINVITGQEYNTLEEANQAKINFIKQFNQPTQKSEQEAFEKEKEAFEKEKEALEEKAKEKELFEGSKGLEEAKKIGVNEEEEGGEIAEAGEG